MNLQHVIDSAVAFECILLKYAAVDEDAALLFSAIGNLIGEAKNGVLVSPMEWRDIPGAYFFNEKSLRKYNDLEEAFAKFRIELTGGDNPVDEFIKN